MHKPFRDPPRSAEAKRRSGPKQSRTERHQRFERRAREREGQNPDVEHRFGIKLQGAVDKALSRIGVPHRSIDYRDAVAREERIELILLGDDRSTAIAEVQFTLRRGVRGKIEDFLRAAIARPLRDVPRLYLEIEDHIGLNLKPMADRIAHAIRDLLDDIGAWLDRAEPGNAIGVALVFDHHEPTKFFPMRLARQLGSRARKVLAELFSPKAVVPPEPEPAPAVVRRKPVAAYRGPIQRIYDWFHQHHRGFIPHPAPAYARSHTSHPLRMPFRR